MLSLSACMIVRDVQSVLPRCLNSIREMCDEICIVDTGSVDATLDIAREYTDQLTVYTGCNDEQGRINNFADARNHCLAMAKGDWIISIDADEIFENPSSIPIKKLIGIKSYSAVSITIARKQTEWQAIRIFKNIPEQRYRNPIHETICVYGEIKACRELLIRDMGQADKREPSAERNLRICNNILSQASENLRARFYRAEANRKLANYTSAASDYIKCLDHPDLNDAYRCATLEALAICFMSNKNWKAAIVAAQAITKIHADIAESYCIMGDAYLGLHDLGNAKRSYRIAANLNCPPKNYNLFIRRSSYGEYPESQLAKMKELCMRYNLDFDGL